MNSEIGEKEASDVKYQYFYFICFVCLLNIIKIQLKCIVLCAAVAV